MELNSTKHQPLELEYVLMITFIKPESTTAVDQVKAAIANIELCLDLDTLGVIPNRYLISRHSITMLRNAIASLESDDIIINYESEADDDHTYDITFTNMISETSAIAKLTPSVEIRVYTNAVANVVRGDGEVIKLDVIFELVKSRQDGAVNIKVVDYDGSIASMLNVTPKLTHDLTTTLYNTLRLDK